MLRALGPPGRSDDKSDPFWRQLVEVDGQMAVQIVPAPEQMAASAGWAVSDAERAALGDLMRKG
jgi:hypothetical protein